MPQTRQHICAERPLRQHRQTGGVIVTQDDIEKFLAAYEDLNRTKRTVQFYRQKLQRLYQNLPEDKSIRYGTLQNWRESLLQNGCAPGSVNAFLSAANSYLDYIGHQEYQLAGQLREEKPSMLELSRAEYLHLLQTAKVPSEKGNPKSLRKLYLATKAGIESNIALLVDQALERMMEQEQFSVGWEEG